MFRTVSTTAAGFRAWRDCCAIGTSVVTLRPHLMVAVGGFVFVLLSCFFCVRLRKKREKIQGERKRETKEGGDENRETEKERERGVGAGAEVFLLLFSSVIRSSVAHPLRGGGGGNFTLIERKQKTDRRMVCSCHAWPHIEGGGGGGLNALFAPRRLCSRPRPASVEGSTMVHQFLCRLEERNQREVHKMFHTHLSSSACTPQTEAGTQMCYLHTRSE